MLHSCQSRPSCGCDPEGQRVEEVLARVRRHVPAGGRQRHATGRAGVQVEDADLARLPAAGVVHAAVHEVATGCGQLHGVRQLHAVAAEPFGLVQAVEVDQPQAARRSR